MWLVRAAAKASAFSVPGKLRASGRASNVDRQRPLLLGMEIHLNPEQESRLAQIASHKGRNTDELVQEVLSRYLEYDARFTEAVNLGLAAADRGDFVEHEEVWANVETILHS